jgi:hypothetical protein
MRTSFGLILLALAAAGCSPSEEEVKGELRAQMMSQCLGDIAPKAAGVPGFDGQSFCTCVTDRAIGNRSVAEIKAMFEDKTGTAEEGRRAGSECLAQQLPGGAGGVPPTAASAPATAEEKGEEKEEAADAER